MAIVQQDEVGIWITAGGWISRPILPTKFKAGDKTESKHFGGSVIVGVGKIEGRGKYSEYWMTCGMVGRDEDSVIRKATWEWYLANCGMEVVIRNGLPLNIEAMKSIRDMQSKMPINPASLRDRI